MPVRKNHFFFSYFGNKRKEIDNIFACIDNYDVEYVVEPFCGSSSFSYHLSKLHPNRYKYVLNDNNKLLIELYTIVKDDEKMKAFEEKINKICSTVDKTVYGKLDKNTVEGYYIVNKIYSMRPGFWNLKYKYKYIRILDSPMCDFLRNENVILSSADGIDVYEEYKKKNSLIFLDPPYLMACNSFYNDAKVNIYQHLYFHKIEHEPAFIMLCLEWSWIIQLLFQNNKVVTYDKKYESCKKKKTTHAVIFNK